MSYIHALVSELHNLASLGGLYRNFAHYVAKILGFEVATSNLGEKRIYILIKLKIFRVSLHGLVRWAASFLMPGSLVRAPEAPSFIFFPSSSSWFCFLLLSLLILWLVSVFVLFVSLSLSLLSFSLLSSIFQVAPRVTWSFLRLIPVA